MTSADCVFCMIARGEVAAHIVYENERVVAFLDRHPLFPGHTLVIPREHIDVLGDLPDELVLPLMRVVRGAARAMESALASQGSFVAQNNHVSQSVPHLHFHVVPRTRGDGLKGFFWPRHTYVDDDAAAKVAARLKAGIAEELARTS